MKRVWAIIRGNRVLEKCRNEKDAWKKLDNHSNRSYMMLVSVDGNGNVIERGLSEYNPKNS